MGSTLLAPQPLPAGTVAPTPNEGIPAIQAYLALFAQAEAYTANQNAANAYLTYQFPNWLLTYEKNNVPGPTPPAPPSMAMVDVSNPWSPQLIYLQAAPPVCAIPAYTPIAPASPAGTIAIGAHDSGLYWNDLPADTYPPSQVPVAGTSQDGITGMWLKIAFPGFGGWWQLVSTSASTPYPGVPVTA